MAAFRFNHPTLGCVRVLTHPSSRKVSARWKQDYLKVVVPLWISKEEILAAIDSMEARIQKMKPSHGSDAIKDIVNEDWRITIGHQSNIPQGVTLSYSFPDCAIFLGSEVDLSSTSAFNLYNKSALLIAKKIAPRLLLPRAAEIADKLGCKPSDIKISHGMKVLGHCNSSKSISLSYINVFLPPHLRDYIICHELAHLTEMNHSERFHALCDCYLSGREKVLVKELNRFQWPVKR